MDLGLKAHSNDCWSVGIEPATPGLVVQCVTEGDSQMGINVFWTSSGFKLFAKVINGLCILAKRLTFYIEA